MEPEAGRRKRAAGYQLALMLIFKTTPFRSGGTPKTVPAAEIFRGPLSEERVAEARVARSWRRKTGR
jgi:hypothetical protein